MKVRENKQKKKITMKSINNFILEYLFLPSAMVAYVFFMAMFIRSTIKDWQREKKEANAAKIKQGNDTK